MMASITGALGMGATWVTSSATPSTPNWAVSVGASYTPVRKPWFSQASRCTSSSSGAEAVVLPGQPLHLLVQQGIDAQGPGLIQGDEHMGGPHRGGGVHQHDVPLDLLPGLRLLHGEFQQLALVPGDEGLCPHAGFQKLVEQVRGGAFHVSQLLPPF